VIIEGDEDEEEESSQSRARKYNSNLFGAVNSELKSSIDLEGSQDSDIQGTFFKVKEKNKLLTVNFKPKKDSISNSKSSIVRLGSKRYDEEQFKDLIDSAKRISMNKNAKAALNLKDSG